MDEDIAGAGLIDISGLDMGELLTEVDSSSLGQALERILSASEEGQSHWFQASI